jgi:hypothetical protein
VKPIVLLLLVAIVTAILLVAAQSQEPGLPAPTEHRIELPADYQATLTHFYTFDRVDNRQVRVI